MKHYVIVNEWAYDYESGVTILGVAHSLNDAKEIFNMYIDDTKEIAERHNYEIYEDTDVMFDSGEDGYYSVNHEKLYIQMVESNNVKGW